MAVVVVDGCCLPRMMNFLNSLNFYVISVVMLDSLYHCYTLSGDDLSLMSHGQNSNRHRPFCRYFIVQDYFDNILFFFCFIMYIYRQRDTHTSIHIKTFKKESFKKNVICYCF